MIAMLALKVTIDVPDPTFLNRLVGVTLTTASGIAAGAALSLAWLHFKDARRHVPDAWDYFYARIGFAVMIGLLAWVLAERPIADATDWRTLVFTAGAVVAARGYGNLVRKNIVKAWRRQRTKP